MAPSVQPTRFPHRKQAGFEGKGALVGEVFWEDMGMKRKIRRKIKGMLFRAAGFFVLLRKGQLEWVPGAA